MSKDYGNGLNRVLSAELNDLKLKLSARERLDHIHMALASRVHESLLPKPVRHPHIDIDTRYLPQDGIGGDYCQVLFPDDLSCYVTICDVTGHGIGPALLATRVSSEVRRLTHDAPRPAEIVHQLNTFLWQHFSDTELQASFFVSRIDLTRNTITYSGAGHPGQLLIRRASDRIEVLKSQNMLLGVADNCLGTEPEQSCAVSAGDRFLFYTDGLIETRGADDQLLGEEGLSKIATHLCGGDVGEVADCIQQRVAQFRRGPVQDDMTFIVAAMK